VRVGTILHSPSAMLDANVHVAQMPFYHFHVVHPVLLSLDRITHPFAHLLPHIRVSRSFIILFPCERPHLYQIISFSGFAISFVPSLLACISLPASTYHYLIPCSHYNMILSGVVRAAPTELRSIVWQGFR
jgi:hypothetical protein